MGFLSMALIGLVASISLGQVNGSDFVTLRGIVLSQNGKPVYGAYLYLDPPEGELPQHIAEGKIDRPDGFSRANGEFFIAKSQGNYRLTVWIGKQRVFVMPIELKGKEQKIEVRLPPLPSLSGKIIDHEGKPLPQMTVVLMNPKTQESRLAVSDSEGEFVFLVPPSGEANIAVIDPSSDQPLIEQKIVIAGEKFKELVLRLHQLPRLTVRILKRDGKPLINASVVVAFRFTSSDLKTDGNGCVTLPPLSQTGEQKILLIAKNEGWAIVTVDPKQLPSQPIEVRLQPFASVSGKVVTPDGKPVEDIEVMVNPTTPGSFFFSDSEQRVRTDKQGQFKFGELWVGTFLVRVQSDRYRLPGIGESIWLAPGQTKTVTVVVAPVKKPTNLGTIVGQVLDAEGKPVAEATVQLNKQLASPFDYMEAIPSEPVKTDERGRFELTNVLPGWHVLSAQTKEGMDVVHWVYVPPPMGGEAPKLEVTLQIPKEFGSIKGRVFRDGGRTPASGVGVMAIESHYYLVNIWGVEEAALNLQIDENQTICIGGG